MMLKIREERIFINILHHI